MTVTVFASAREASLATARQVVDALRANPRLVLGLPAGRTPIEAYAELRRLHSSGDAGFSAATAFLLDEFVGVNGSDPRSFRHFIERHLLSGIDVDAGQVHSLNGAAPDLDAECERYERAIDAAGGLDLLLLGIGVNGHIGFNEPGDALAARTHRTTLLESTRRDNAGLFGGDAALVPREALSMGLGTILRSGAIVMLATGQSKAAAVRGMLRGPVTPRLPASLLQLHRQVEVYLDPPAASAL